MTYFDPSVNEDILVDTSPKGLGAMILQKHHPIQRMQVVH